jgi:hypothetical protein
MLSLRTFRMSAVGLAALALLPALAYGQGATPADWDKVKMLRQAAYYSDGCRQRAEALAIAPTNAQAANAQAWVAAFLDQRAAAPSVGGPDATRDPCELPHVLLINLLRSHGFDADLVFVSTATAGVLPGKIDALLVFVAALDRYVDPMAPATGRAVVDGVIRGHAHRMHIAGPAVNSSTPGACPDSCMLVFHPTNDVDSVRVRTERIRGR